MQHELRELAPGSAGGRAVRNRHGVEYFRALGARGGRTTAARYGREYMRLTAIAGALARWWRPRTIHTFDGVTLRRLPYWNSRSRRRRPVLIYNEVI